MQESTFFQEHLERATKRLEETTERLKQEALERGLQQGLQQGIEQGKAQGIEQEKQREYYSDTSWWYLERSSPQILWLF